MNSRLAACVLVSIVAGCASTPPADTTAAAKPQQSCEREYRTGSLMPVKECAPPMTEEERQRMADELANRVRPSASSKSGG